MLIKKLKLCFISLFIIISTMYSQQSMIEQSRPYNGLIYYENNSKLYISYMLTRVETDYVLIEWRGAQLPGLSYQLYRHTEPITDYNVLSKASLIAIVNATSKNIDYRVKDILPRRGLYYYAIACVLNNSQLIFTGTPSIDMTPRAIELDNNGSIRYSTAIPYEDGEAVKELGYAKQSTGNNVLYWQEAPNYNGNYLIYKSDKVIDNIRNLNKAKLIGKTQSSFFVDALTTDDNDSYYYVVIDDKKKKDIYSYGNNIQSPSATQNADTTTQKRFTVKNLSVVNDTSRVVLNWQTPSVVKSSSYFVLITSAAPFKSGMNAFDNSSIIDIKNIEYNSVSFINDNAKYLFVPRKKDYVNAFIYYAMLLVEDSNPNAYILYDGMFTKYPVKISTLQAVDTKKQGTPAFLQGEKSMDIPQIPLPQSKNSASGLINTTNIYNFTDISNTNTLESKVVPKKDANNNNTFTLPPLELFYDDNNETDSTNEVIQVTNTNSEVFTNDSLTVNPPKVNSLAKTNDIITNEKIDINNDNTILTNEKPLVIINEQKKEDVREDKDELKNKGSLENKEGLKNVVVIDEKYSNAIKLFNKGDYKGSAKILEEISSYDDDIRRYCNINILLGRSYYKLKDKGRAISAFRRASDRGATEANIWIKKAMNEL